MNRFVYTIKRYVTLPRRFADLETRYYQQLGESERMHAATQEACVLLIELDKVMDHGSDISDFDKGVLTARLNKYLREYHVLSATTGTIMSLFEATQPTFTGLEPKLFDQDDNIVGDAGDGNSY